MEKTGLILEGGGMRGLYTIGVLDYFMDHDLYLPYVVGVSAGACNGCSYVSRQRGRNYKINIGYIRDPRYLSLRSLIKTGSLFGMDFIFKDMPHHLVPLDYDTFYNSDTVFYIGTTDCNTGKEHFFSKEEMDYDCTPLAASSSLPILSPIVHYQGLELMDGGIADSIPIEKSISDGNTKHVVILTRDRGYRKGPGKHMNLLRRKYRKYPAFITALANRHIMYNHTLDKLRQMEAEGSAFVIAPQAPVPVKSTSKNKEKLQALYDTGYLDASRCFDRLLEFLEK